VWGAEPDLNAIAGRMPVLVATGGHSPVFEAAADHLSTALSARRCVLVGAGHFVQRDMRFAAVLRDFLASIPADHLI
jgi:hypothetical protein